MTPPSHTLSLGWWKRSHNTHHVVCNSVENDPDIQHLPVFAVAAKCFDWPFLSSYHNKTFGFGAIERFLVTHQVAKTQEGTNTPKTKPFGSWSG
jgi:fatty acid desaturase